MTSFRLPAPRTRSSSTKAGFISATKHNDVSSKTHGHAKIQGACSGKEHEIASRFNAAQREVKPALRNGKMGLPDCWQIRFTSSIAA
jgi:hypothetical protein